MIGNPLKLIAWLTEQNSDKEYEIKEYSPKRGNKANAYYWKLVELITEERRKDGIAITTLDTHRELLSDYGAWEKDENGETIFKIFLEGKESKQEYYSKPLAKVSIKGEKQGEGVGYMYAVVKGSHEYNAREMNALIKGAIYDAQSLGIETKTPEEIQQLIKEMEGK